MGSGDGDKRGYHLERGHIATFLTPHWFFLCHYRKSVEYADIADDPCYLYLDVKQVSSWDFADWTDYLETIGLMEESIAIAVYDAARKGYSRFLPHNVENSLKSRQLQQEHCDTYTELPDRCIIEAFPLSIESCE